jgi:hypothetical protein
MRINREQLKQLVLEEIKNSRINEDDVYQQRVGPHGDPYVKADPGRASVPLRPRSVYKWSQQRVDRHGDPLEPSINEDDVYQQRVGPEGDPLYARHPDGTPMASGAVERSEISPLDLAGGAPLRAVPAVASLSKGSIQGLAQALKPIIIDALAGVELEEGVLDPARDAEKAAWAKANMPSAHQVKEIPVDPSAEDGMGLEEKVMDEAKEDPRIEFSRDYLKDMIKEILDEDGELTEELPIHRDAEELQGPLSADIAQHAQRQAEKRGHYAPDPSDFGGPDVRHASEPSNVKDYSKFGGREAAGRVGSDTWAHMDVPVSDEVYWKLAGRPTLQHENEELTEELPIHRDAEEASRPDSAANAQRAQRQAEKRGWTPDTHGLPAIPIGDNDADPEGNYGVDISKYGGRNLQSTTIGSDLNWRSTDQAREKGETELIEDEELSEDSDKTLNETLDRWKKLSGILK